MADEKKPENKSPEGKVHDLVLSFQGEIANALPRFIDAETFIRTALTMLKQSPRLLQCTQGSLMVSLLRAAAVGLPPDGILGLAFLIPRSIKRQVAGQWTKVLEANFQIGYQGWAELARRSGEVTYIAARVVRQRDRWEPPRYSLHEDNFLHEPYFGADDAGPIIGGYGVMRFKGGEASSLALPIQRIYDEHRKFSQAYDAQDKECPWVKFEEAMIQKTLITAICKHAPKSAELRHAATLDDRLDKGIDAGDEDHLRKMLARPGGPASAQVIDIASFTSGAVVDEPEKKEPEKKTAPTVDEKDAAAMPEPKQAKASVKVSPELVKAAAVEVPPEDREVADLFGSAD